MNVKSKIYTIQSECSDEVLTKFAEFSFQDYIRQTKLFFNFFLKSWR